MEGHYTQNPKLATDRRRRQALSADPAVLFGWSQCLPSLLSLTLSLYPEQQRPSHKAMPSRAISPTLRELTRQRWLARQDAFQGFLYRLVEQLSKDSSSPWHLELSCTSSGRASGFDPAKIEKSEPSRCAV